MKKCGLNPSTLGSDSQDRSAWRSMCNEVVTQFEDERVAVLQHKRAVRKPEAQPLSNLGTWPCDHCSRICSSMCFFASNIVFCHSYVANMEIGCKTLRTRKLALKTADK